MGCIFQWWKIRSMHFRKMIMAKCQVRANITQTSLTEVNVCISLVHLSTNYSQRLFEPSDCPFCTTIALVLLWACSSHQKGVPIWTSANQLRHCTLCISVEHNGWSCRWKPEMVQPFTNLRLHMPHVLVFHANNITNTTSWQLSKAQNLDGISTFVWN